MTKVQRGFFWLGLLALAAVSVAAFLIANLLNAGAAAAASAHRYERMAEQHDDVLGQASAIRGEIERLQRAYIVADTAPQAEAKMRQLISEWVRRTGGVLSAIETPPTGPDAPEGLLRVQVRYAIGQELLTGALNDLARQRPVLIVDASDISIARSGRSAGSNAAPTTAPLEVALDLSAFWRPSRGKR